jgi:hypothetical protein
MKKDISKDISSAIMQQEMSMSKSKMMGYKNSDEIQKFTTHVTNLTV